MDDPPMKCPVCGSQNPDSSETCSVCGYDYEMSRLRKPKS
ncbi:zinc-ribbon domain-containing protein [Sodalinema gerasimenkoae]